MTLGQDLSLTFLQILPAITMNTQDTLFTNMMKRLNLSSDEPLRAERATPPAPPAQSMNLNVPLPGQTTLDSEDEVGNENHGFGDDSVGHTVLNNVLKSADIKRKEENYARASATLENGLLSSIHVHGSSKRDAVDVSIQTTSASVGVQTSLPNGIIHPLMVDKCVQVSMPLLVRASEVPQLNSSGDDNSIPLLNLRGQDNTKKVNESSFSNRRTQNTDRPGTPVTKLVSKKINHGNEKMIGNQRNNSSSRGSYKHTANFKTNSGGKSKMNRGETNDVMTVLDIADESP